MYRNFPFQCIANRLPGIYFYNFIHMISKVLTIDCLAFGVEVIKGEVGATIDKFHDRILGVFNGARSTKTFRRRGVSRNTRKSCSLRSSTRSCSSSATKGNNRYLIFFIRLKVKQEGRRDLPIQ